MRSGKDDVNILPRIVASTTKIQGKDYRSIVSVPTDDDKSLMDVGEGAFIPETVITTQENLISLKKRGRMLVASYEAIRFQRLDVFTVMLRQIGAYMAAMQLKDAIDVIINGDGNDNPCDNITSAAKTLAYSDLVNLWNSFAPYEMTTLIASPAMMTSLLNLTEFRDAAAGLNFHATGKMITPLGAELIKSSAVPDNQILALDNKAALEKIQSGEIIVDHDRLIDRQLDRTAITCTCGFGKICAEASKSLTLATA